MKNLYNLVSEENDYVLSCATLLGPSGFPKAAFIKMVGNEYASDIFSLINNGQLMMNAAIITYPRRSKRKKRINIDAQMKFYQEMMHELTAFILEYFDKRSIPFTINDMTTMRERIVIPSDVDCNTLDPFLEYSLKYHRNKGKYLCEALNQAVNKLSISKTDVNTTFLLLGWYYAILGKKEESTMAFSKVYG